MLTEKQCKLIIISTRQHIEHNEELLEQNEFQDFWDDETRTCVVNQNEELRKIKKQLSEIYNAVKGE